MKRLLVLVGLVLGASAAVAQTPTVISWSGNTKAANQRLGVSEIRLGCSGAPTQCMASLGEAVASQGVDKVSLAITIDTNHVADYALQFSTIKQKDSRLVGIGLDDFVNALTQWKTELKDPAAPGRLLRTVIDNTKKASPDLKFEITLYEDQISSQLLADAVMPADLRAKIDRVSLYLHFRANGDAYASFVKRAHQVFPNAVIFAGAYPYDRVDYLRCTQAPGGNCTPEQEASMYERTLAAQLALVKSGAVAGIEYYPGNFGTEQTWYGWAVPKVCGAARRQQCVDATIKMHEATYRLMGK